MLRVAKILKPWKEADSFPAHINLYGFWNETVFLTKSGDLGMVLRVTGVDYESLDYGKQESAVKRLEAALKNFSPDSTFTSTCSRPTTRRFPSPITIIRSCRPAKTGGSNTSQRKPTGSSKSKSTTRLSSRARGRRPD